jgi:hypothetical protein
MIITLHNVGYNFSNHEQKWLSMRSIQAEAYDSDEDKQLNEISSTQVQLRQKLVKSRFISRVHHGYVVLSFLNDWSYDLLAAIRILYRSNSSIELLGASDKFL